MQVPDDIFETAIKSYDEEDNRSSFDNLKFIMAIKSVMEFESSFVQFLVNLVLISHIKRLYRDNIVTHHSIATCHEIARTLRVF